MKLIKSFAAFMDRTVNLNQGRVEQANAAFDTLTKFVSNADATTAIVRDTFRQGSLRQGTIIKPRTEETEFDVDMLVRVEDVNGWEARDYLNAFHLAFSSSDRYRGLLDAKSKQHRCVTINYATNDFHVDVVPSTERNGQCLIMNRETNQFEPTDGDGYAAWFEGRNAVTSGNLVRAVRLTKYLRDEHGWPVKSILLTTLLGMQVYGNDNPGEFPDVPTTLKVLFERLDAWLQYQKQIPVVSNPALPSEHFTRHWDEAAYEEFKEGVHDAAQVITAAFHETDGEASGKLWIDAFGEEFRVLDEDLEGGEALSRAAFALGDAGHARPLNDIAPRGHKPIAKVSILARAHNKSGLVPFRSIGSGDRVLAGRTIKFKAVTNATGDYDLHWQVVNTGKHATSKSGLRGGFFRGRNLKNQLTGTVANWERAEYTGQHWIQCFIVRDDVCIAMSDKFYINVYNPQFA
jgi:hypothetical protein